MEEKAKVSWLPPFVTRDIEYLPEWIGAELEVFEDAAMPPCSEPAPAIHHWLATGGASGNLAAIAGLLDLIHTNYFSSPLCVKLLAVAISESHLVSLPLLHSAMIKTTRRLQSGTIALAPLITTLQGSP